MIINYTTARKEFTNLVSGNQGIKSAYEAGSVSVPGLSDLDFILILDDRWDVSDTKIFYDSLSCVSSNLKAAIGPGNILLIPSYLEKEMLNIDDFKLKSISSTTPAVAVNRYQDEYTEICRILDWLPERINTIGNFLNHQYAVMDNFNKYFQLHGLLKSLLLSMNKANSIVQCNKSQKIFTKNNKLITDLRNTWYKLNDAEKETNIQDTANLMFSDALEMLDIFCVHVAKKIMGSVTFKTTASGLKKFETFELSQVTEWSLFSRMTYKYEFHDLVFLNFFLQAQLNNEISDKIKKSINYSDQVKFNNFNEFTNQFSKTIQRRVNYVNENYLFLKRAKLHNGLLKYGMYLKDE